MDFSFVIIVLSVPEFIVGLRPEDFMAADVHSKAFVATPIIKFEFAGRNIDERKLFFPVCFVPTRHGQLR